MGEDDTGGLLFEGVVYTVIPGDTDGLDIDDLIQALDSGGGRQVALREPDQQIDHLDELSHIVSSHIDFPQYVHVLELGIPVVRPGWVLASVKKRRQASTRQYSPDPAQFFHHVVATCADIPNGDAEAIAAGVIALGGQYSEHLSKLVTHVVTLTMDHPIIYTMKEKGHPGKIVLPHWFDDCFKLGKKIGEKPYLLPDPEYLAKDSKTNVKPVSSQHLAGAVSASPPEGALASPPPSPSKDRKNLNAFKSKKLFLSDDLELSHHILDMLRRLIDHGGGIVTKDADKADIYICQWRAGPGYIAASQAGIEVANLSWLYHVINRNRYTSPLSKLFHYPLPPNGIDGFNHLKISLSNYSGDARTYVENLIRACGAEYTKTMKQDNTHLITAHMHGEKSDAAQEWNLNIVNHLWLEESYAKCAIQSITNPKYTHFPTHTNLGEVTGQTSLDMKSVERKYFPKPRSPHRPRIAQQPTPRKNVPESSAVCGQTRLNGSEPDMPATVAEADGTEVEHDAAPKTAKRNRGRPSGSEMATPGLIDEKENESPVVTSTGRASKAKAIQNIHGYAPDMALFQKEMKRKGGVTHGGWRSTDAEEASPVAQRSSRKRPSDEFEPTGMEGDLSDGETQKGKLNQAKRTKHAHSSALPPIEYRIMVTGDERWNGNPNKESADKIALRGLGVLLTQDPKDVDILVAPKILRTRKFVCALSCGPLVVDTSFLDTALNKRKLVKNHPMLQDRDSEERFGFELADSVQRAKENKHKLFRGWSIYVTESITGGFDTYKDIISLNGGSALLYKGRLGLTVVKLLRTGDDSDAGTESCNQGGDDEIDYIYLVSGTSDKEVKLWKPFREHAAKQDLEARVVSSDWLLNAAMSQQIVFDEKWTLAEGKL